MNLAPWFNVQFFDPTTGEPLSGGLLHTYISGTVTPQLTYQAEDGVATNTNPIVLDAAGQCNLWLNPALTYTMLWTRADGSGARSIDNVVGSADANGIVTSVNGETGDVTLTADDIGYTTGTSTSWFIGTDVGAALDAIITQVDSGIPAASIDYSNTTSGLTATDVQGAIDEIAARANGGALLRITLFTASGTWTKGADVGFVVVKGVGGGGGSTTSTTTGGGGGAGGYFEALVTTPLATETVTVGAGGAAGSTGASTSFGAHATATGGLAGGASSGGAGGGASGGSLNLQGGGGGWGLFVVSGGAFYGAGGNSVFGGGAPGTRDGSAGVPGAANTGGGGSGSPAGGAAGGSGLVLVYEYS